MIKGPLHGPIGGGTDIEEVQALIDDSIALHELAADPHPDYLTEVEADLLYQPLDDTADDILTLGEILAITSGLFLQ